MMGSENLARAACRWAREHPGRFGMLEALVLSEAAAGNPCIRRGDIWILAQKRGMSVSDSDLLRFDNNLWSGLARLLIMRNPQLAGCIHLRRSGMDALDLEAIWEEEA